MSQVTGLCCNTIHFQYILMHVLYYMYFSHSFEMYTFTYRMNVYIREPVEKKCGGLDWVIFHTFKNKIKKIVIKIHFKPLKKESKKIVTLFALGGWFRPSVEFVIFF